MDEINEEKLIGEVEKQEESKIPVLRTFRSDQADYIKDQNVSLASIAAKQSTIGTIEEPRTSSWKYAIALGVVLILIIALGIASYFLIYKKAPTTEQVAQGLPKPILVSDAEHEVLLNFEVKNINQVELIKNEIYATSQIPLKNLVYIPIVIKTGEEKSLMKSVDFFKLIGITPPVRLISSLDDRFMLARFQDQKIAPVLLFKIKAFDIAFAGMIEWEKLITKDLGNIFIFDTIKELDTLFHDEELKNRDVRILKDADGNIVLMYSFINKDYLVITTSQNAMEEIFRRFSLPQYLNK